MSPPSFPSLPLPYVSSINHSESRQPTSRSNRSHQSTNTLIDHNNCLDSSVTRPKSMNHRPRVRIWVQRQWTGVPSPPKKDSSTSHDSSHTTLVENDRIFDFDWLRKSSKSTQSVCGFGTFSHSQCVQAVRSVFFPAGLLPKEKSILANCPYLIGTVPILTQEKGWKKELFDHVSLFLQKSIYSNV